MHRHIHELVENEAHGDGDALDDRKTYLEEDRLLILGESVVAEPAEEEDTQNAKHQGEEGYDPLIEDILEDQGSRLDRALSLGTPRCYSDVGTNVEEAA